MSWIQLKNTGLTKNQENHYMNKKRQSTEINTKMNQMSELFEKDYKAAIIKMLQQMIINGLETYEN